MQLTRMATRSITRLRWQHAAFAWLAAALLCVSTAGGQTRATNTARPAATPEAMIIDTDIGDDVDDVFALGLALASPEVRILGITTAWANPDLKARLVDRLLCETGRTDIPVAVGIDKHAQGQGALTQARWAERQPQKPHPAAVDFLLEQIRQHPGEITLIGIGPLTNLGAAIERDPATFKLLKRIVIMGGSVRRGYDEMSFSTHRGPDPEYNIVMDVPAAQAVFNAGVALYVMPLDSTQIKLDLFKQQLLFTASTNLTDAMALLYQQWSRGHSLTEPTLYDDMAVAYTIEPSLCPATPMRLEVDARGYTREQPGSPNTFVCLKSDSDAFFNFFMPRILGQKLSGSCAKTQ
jgi:inosine-uridine nucleoside N-ribohydrolase